MTRARTVAPGAGQQPGHVDNAQVTPFGLDGPLADWRATALTAFAAGGQMMLCGDPEAPPLKTAGHQAASVYERIPRCRARS